MKKLLRLFLCFLLAFPLAVTAQEPAAPLPQPQRSQSYEQWALQQELVCRATLQAIWEQGNAKGREVEQLKQDKKQLEEALAEGKETAHAPIPSE